MPQNTARKTGKRRLPTQEELRIWRDFIETAEALRNALSARLQGETGLSPADYAVLLALSEADEHRIRSSDLAAVIGWQRSRLSHHLARMEPRGLICREECATDSRGADVVLTAEGAEAFRAATFPHLAAVRELFVDALTPPQLDALAGITAALREHHSKPENEHHSKPENEHHSKPENGHHSKRESGHHSK